MKWEPIETAPKDGRQVLLANGAHVDQGWWEDDDGETGWFSWLCFPAKGEPTHWMPLPEPPQ